MNNLSNTAVFVATFVKKFNFVVWEQVRWDKYLRLENNFAYDV